VDDIRLGSRTLQPRRQLLVHGRREPLGKRALDILSVLAEARGAIVTKDELLEAVWPGVTVEENALQVHIVALRKALGPEAERLKTIRGVGYQLDSDAVTDGLGATPSGSIPKQAHRGSAVESPAAWNWLRRSRPALIIVALLALLLVAGVFAGPKLGLWGGERIPVVVKTFAASGSGDPTEAALANGITDELIDRLRRIPELRVATVGPNGSIEEASFKNAYVVDGSIRRNGDQLRVMTRLADGKGEILWSQTFDRRLVDLLEIQQRIATSIADALSVSFDVGNDSTEFGGTDNPEAYAAYLEARANVFNPDESARHLERALALDPDYIQALAAQAFSYQIRINSSFGLSREQVLLLLEKMDESSARAVDANPNLWIGQGARGGYYAVRGDYVSAQERLRRLAELDHGREPQLRFVIGDWEGFFGRRNKGLALLNTGELMDPDGRYRLAKVRTLVDLGRYREAIDLAEEVGADDVRVFQNMSGEVFWSYLELGQETKAIQFSERYFPAWAEGLRASRANKALPTMSLAALRLWADDRFGAGGGIHLVNAAHFAGYGGHPVLAVHLLRLAFERPSGGLVFLLWHPALAEARKTDEFERLVTDIGLVKVWRESGDWGDFCRPVSPTEINCH
jgi:DNA-binding winged helix-turn-helix (wHTH) protein/TolB-like protein